MGIQFLLEIVIKYECLFDCRNLWIMINIDINFVSIFYKKGRPTNEKKIFYFSLNILISSFDSFVLQHTIRMICYFMWHDFKVNKIPFFFFTILNSSIRRISFCYFMIQVKYSRFIAYFKYFYVKFQAKVCHNVIFIFM